MEATTYAITLIPICLAIWMGVITQTLFSISKDVYTIKRMLQNMEFEIVVTEKEGMENKSCDVDDCIDGKVPGSK